MKNTSTHLFAAFRQWLRRGAENNSVRQIPDPLEQFLLMRSPAAAGFDRLLLPSSLRRFAR